ncbi:recombinase family protein [Chitinophaga cymbidii]|uniref:recombinase family protein n=1 Tax=Chitinophaga cymbidii TaxID=1096750 RepID=UPI0011BE8A7A|nr:recombinase family protein [Chitinophaga cymbidii]
MNAIGYIRLSRKDQSKYSLAGQESAIISYCTKYGLQLLNIFTDNGQCSDTFERTNFKALEYFLHQNKGVVRYLIVMDHDRFSRDLSQALSKINELRRKYGVDVLSVDEPIDLNTSDPQIFISRTLKYAMANLELLNIRKRLRNGIRNAMQSGRFMQKAPFGYRNGLDISGKSTLVVKEAEATIVRKIFQDYRAGLPMYLIYEAVKPLGFPNTGNSAIRRVLQNCVYAGLISIEPTFEQQKVTFVRALHEPIVKEENFWLVQHMLKTSRNKAQPHKDFPLRGHLRCSCGRSMTAGWSKGRKKYYQYYRCVQHSNINLPERCCMKSLNAYCITSLYGTTS